MTPAFDGPAVVIGVGNALLRDDGVGVRVVEELRAVVRHDASALPEDTVLVDGGTLGLDLLRTVAGARSLLFLDAVDLHLPPGTVTVLRGDAIPAAGGRWGRAVPSGVGEVLAVGRLMGWLPDPVALVGVQVDDTEFGIGLSRPVESALPRAVVTAREELRELDRWVIAARPRMAGIGVQEGATA